MFVCVALTGIHTKKSKVCQAPEQLLSTSLNFTILLLTTPQGKAETDPPGFPLWEHLISTTAGLSHFRGTLRP